MVISELRTPPTSGSTAVGASAESLASSQSVGEERKEGLIKEVSCMVQARSSVHPFYSHSVVRVQSWGHTLLPERLWNGVWLCTQVERDTVW